MKKKTLGKIVATMLFLIVLLKLLLNPDSISVGLLALLVLWTGISSGRITKKKHSSHVE
ncbi:hypothetical protein [Ligilactobacillus murinus]|uniref:hypothetical protein n=1 Tax=Ligilactobacillus murinus TaxID=1622 RepID=UPI001430395D|nr:hypothetical protein [Ligilactobacillus murinus]MBF0759167.1 hypothetical protein [Ligilactobacillus murinus]MBF0831396.1 hypothetical protein [Ligilactobacillus murinus]